MREKVTSRQSSGRPRKTIGPTHTPTAFVAEVMTELIDQEVAANVRLPKTLSKWASKMKMSVLKKSILAFTFSFEYYMLISFPVTALARKAFALESDSLDSLLRQKAELDVKICSKLEQVMSLAAQDSGHP